MRLATSEAFSGLMIRILSELKARHPALTVDILSGNRPLDLTRGEADIAVRLMATPQPDLISRKIGESGWSLYAAESYLRRSGIPGDASDLAGHDLIDFDEAMASVPGAEWLRKHGEGARVVLRGNSIIAVLNAAVQEWASPGCRASSPMLEPGLRRLTPDHHRQPRRLPRLHAGGGPDRTRPCGDRLHRREPRQAIGPATRRCPRGPGRPGS